MRPQGKEAASPSPSPGGSPSQNPGRSPSPSPGGSPSLSPGCIPIPEPRWVPFPEPRRVPFPEPRLRPHPRAQAASPSPSPDGSPSLSPGGSPPLSPGEPLSPSLGSSSLNQSGSSHQEAAGLCPRSLRKGRLQKNPGASATNGTGLEPRLSVSLRTGPPGTEAQKHRYKGQSANRAGQRQPNLGCWEASGGQGPHPECWGAGTGPRTRWGWVANGPTWKLTGRSSGPSRPADPHGSQTPPPPFPGPPNTAPPRTASHQHGKAWRGPATWLRPHSRAGDPLTHAPRRPPTQRRFLSAQQVAWRISRWRREAGAGLLTHPAPGLWL